MWPKQAQQINLARNDGKQRISFERERLQLQILGTEIVQIGVEKSCGVSSWEKQATWIWNIMEQALRKLLDGTYLLIWMSVS